MSTLIRRWTGAALTLSAVLLAIDSARAAPPRLHALGPPVQRSAPRLARIALVRSSLVPSPFARHTVEAVPIRALPLLVARPSRPTFPALLPRLGRATLLAPFDAGDCGVPQARTLLAVLPTTPFAPAACQRGAQDEAVPRTTLAPGRNKNALYGPGFAPHGDDVP